MWDGKFSKNDPTHYPESATNAKGSDVDHLELQDHLALQNSINFEEGS